MRKLFFFPIAFVLFICLSACGESSPSTSTEDSSDTENTSDKKYTFTVSLANPNNSYQSDFLEFLNKELQEKSDGRLSLEVYPNSQLMPADQEIPGLLNGQVDMVMTQTGLASSVEPAFSIFEMPFLWNSDPDNPAAYFNKVQSFLQDENGGGILESKMEDRGIKIIGNTPETPSAIGMESKDNLITNIDSMKGLKLRTAGGKYGPKVVDELGASGMTIAAPEVIPALEQGVIDGVISSTQYIYVNKFPVETVTVVPVANWVNLLLISLEQYESLPADLQKILDEASKGMNEYAIDYMIENSTNLGKDYESAGIELYYPTEDESKVFREAIAPVWDEFTKSVDEGQKLLDAAVKANGN